MHNTKHLRPELFVWGFSFLKINEMEIIMKKMNQKALINLTGIAMLSAVAFVLQFLDFSVPVMPSFIKLDFSDLPELIGAFAYGPWAGVAIALIKNLLHLMSTSTVGVGELSNFLLGATFSFTAGMIYKHKKSKKGALLSGVIGSAAMAGVGVVTNYFLIYPLYYKVVKFPEAAILGMYKALVPSVQNIFQALLIFNFPFTFVKGLLCVLICYFIYKPLSPILHGRSRY